MNDSNILNELLKLTLRNDGRLKALIEVLLGTPEKKEFFEKILKNNSEQHREDMKQALDL